MGSGSSKTKVQKFDEGNQTDPVPGFGKPPVTNSSSQVPPKTQEPIRVPPQAKPNKSRVPVQDDLFKLDTNIEEYSTIWDQDIKLSSTFQQALKSSSKKIEHHQKETSNNQWDNTNSTTCDSAHVGSIVNTQTHSCINLSSSDKTDVLITNLNNIHTHLDDKMKHRTNEISSETGSILTHILNETQQKQQRLLIYAKEQQFLQDENYQKSLQEYLNRLQQQCGQFFSPIRVKNKIKAKELADLQKQLQIYRKQIIEELQLKIMTVNDQANEIKKKILQEEQYRASEKIDSIISEIRKISTDERGQYLGSEMIRETNIKTNAHVGTKASGQECVFEIHHNNHANQRSQSNRKTPN